VTTRFRKSFTRDLKKLKDSTILKRVKAVIEKLEAAQHLSDLMNVKKVSGARTSTVSAWETTVLV
jgi:mRNA-degrading endonuclease YafQ of YafQ-DinJ toxin-antitoxin module